MPSAGLRLGGRRGTDTTSGYTRMANCVLHLTAYIAVVVVVVAVVAVAAVAAAAAAVVVVGAAAAAVVVDDDVDVAVAVVALVGNASYALDSYGDL